MGMFDLLGPMNDKARGVLEKLASQCLNEVITWEKAAADGAAATTTAESTIIRAPFALGVFAAYYVPAAALTADNTNFATITIAKRDVNGANSVTLATVTTQITGSGNWTAFKPVPIPLQSTAVNLAAGEVLTVTIGKSGSGVVVPIGMVHLDTTSLI
jgi:hypothetical protein